MAGSTDRINEEQVLRTEPSFAIYSNDEDKFGGLEDIDDGKKLEKWASIGESIEPEFTFGKNSMGMIEEDSDDDDDDESGSNRVRDSRSHNNNDYHDNPLIRGNPSSPLALRSYAHYLESRGDILGAEEYYSRAIQADPDDAETLSEYAAFLLEVRGDRVRASNYFERAAMAAPDDSNVLAARASFLWKIDEDDNQGEGGGGGEISPNAKVDESSVPVNQSGTDFKQEKQPSSPRLHLAMGLGVDATGFCRDIKEVHYVDEGEFSGEEHYRRLVENDPHNPFFLRNYANFLHQSKGDLRGAEEYYSRAILSDPSHGQTYSLYADVLWQLHRDRDRAAAYFKQAIQAAPEDSNVVAAYAKFLWETESEDNTDVV